MNSELKYLPIHWKNGMAFSQKHLSDQYLAVLNSIRDAIAIGINSYNYGLLGGDSHLRYSDSFEDNANNEKVEISRCRAITQNGSRIEILNHKWEELNVPLSELSNSIELDDARFWFVLLIIDPYQRIPEGIEDEKESPRRKPYTRPAFQLELISAQDLERDSFANAIPLFKYEKTHTGLKKAADYIPPCARISSHFALVRAYEKFERYLSTIKESSEKIIEKIREKRRKGEGNILADDLDALCKEYLKHYVRNYDQYKFTLKDQPPIKLVEFFAQFARVIDHCTSMARDKNHMFQYFQKRTIDIIPSKLERIIRDPYESNYYHYDIAVSLEVINKFLDTFDKIFKRLVQLDFKELVPEDIVTRDTYSDRERDRGIIKKNRPKVVKKRNYGNLGDELK